MQEIGDPMSRAFVGVRVENILVIIAKEYTPKHYDFLIIGQTEKPDFMPQISHVWEGRPWLTNDDELELTDKEMDLKVAEILAQVEKVDE